MDRLLGADSLLFGSNVVYFGANSVQIQLMREEELRERVTKLLWGGRTDVDGVIDLIQSQKLAYAEQETIKLASHLAYMAGEFEGMTGHKSAYLLKNWPAYKSMSEQRERNHV